MAASRRAVLGHWPSLEVVRRTAGRDWLRPLEFDRRLSADTDTWPFAQRPRSRGDGPSSFRVEPNSQNRWSSSSPVGMWAGCL
jgi:hypothetical protein